MDNRAGALCYRRIILRGVVQGVGFRPFAARTAARHCVSGWVRNDGGAVVIHARGGEQAVAFFCYELAVAPPPGSWVADAAIDDIPPFEAEGFNIVPSGDNAVGGAFVSPDIAVCPDCLREVFDPQDRRYGHLFNSCVACGPRYSVIERLPYDRERTAMRDFPLCDECAREYADIKDRRHHAQTVCCHSCGPALRLTGGERNANALAQTVALLRQGKIVAVKGVGGYHFACLPDREEAAAALRRLKGRDEKPFAVMFRDVQAVREICALSDDEERLLTSPARPITLLALEKSAFAPSALCGDDRCGCFLPYTALHHMMLAELPALVMTSANASGGAILIDDSEILRFCKRSGVSVLTHDRRIVRAAEDSVARVAYHSVQILRRARGYAPGPFAIPNRSGRDFLAMGGDLKAAFCAVKGGYASPGPHMGDLAEKSVYDRFRASARDFCSLLGVHPSFIVCDAHPGYFSTALAEEWGLPVLRVQHHHSHIASVMAEHGIHENVIGVAFDGTGYGEDGGVWGGEFLICREEGFRRAAHLKSITVLGGDDMAKDARKSAFCALWSAGAIDPARLEDRERVMAAALASGVNTIACSSMGRLFDAAAAVVGAAYTNGYEGQCAVALERTARLALKHGVKPYPLRFAVGSAERITADGASVIRDMRQAAHQADPGALALGFHTAVADMTLEVCSRLREEHNCPSAALSGGVFQNELLLTLTMDRLNAAGFEIHINRAVPPNDGGLSLGQAYVGGNSVCA